MLDDNLYELKDVQTELLEIFNHFNNFCVDNSIAYSALAGTLLGAVREKGFIPWDDDIDVAMDLNNYSKLVDKLKNNHDFFIDIEDTWVPRFRSVKSPKGPFIDIFIITDVPKGIIKKLKVLQLKALQGMLKKYETKKNISLFYKALLIITKAFGKLFPRQFLLNEYRKVCYGKKYYNRDYYYIPTGAFVHLNLEFEKRKLDNGYINLPFENINIKAYKEYDYILKVYYGNDYMIPVKDTERKPAHLNQIKSI